MPTAGLDEFGRFHSCRFIAALARDLCLQVIRSCTDNKSADVR